MNPESRVPRNHNDSNISFSQENKFSALAALIIRLFYLYQHPSKHLCLHLMLFSLIPTTKEIQQKAWLITSANFHLTLPLGFGVSVEWMSFKSIFSFSRGSPSQESYLTLSEEKQDVGSEQLSSAGAQHGKFCLQSQTRFHCQCCKAERCRIFLWLMFLTPALQSGALWKWKNLGLGDALNENLLTLGQAGREEQAGASREGKWVKMG